MKKVDLIVFDLDGTLVNTGDDLTSAVNHTLALLNMPLLKKETVLRFVGDGIGKLVERSLGNENHHRFDNALDIFRVYYAEHMLDETKLYQGVKEVLDYFKVIRKCIVTNKTYEFALSVTRALGIEGYFDDIIGMGSTVHIKPDPNLVYMLLERYGIKAERAAIVGDGKNDMMMAKKSGVTSCAFLNGFTRREILLSFQPDYTVENMVELKEIFS